MFTESALHRFYLKAAKGLKKIFVWRIGNKTIVLKALYNNKSADYEINKRKNVSFHYLTRVIITEMINTKAKVLCKISLKMYADWSWSKLNKNVYSKSYNNVTLHS